MSVIKPGRIGLAIVGSVNAKKRPPTAKPREVWDDFSSEKLQQAKKPSAKKKEYERGAGNRMVPVSMLEGQLNGRDANGHIPEELTTEGERYDARTDFEILEAALGYKFSDYVNLQRALTHRSALGVRERVDYERLEFLGDAVLDLGVAHLLSDLHPEAREGELSKMRAALVNTQALAGIARDLGIGGFIKLGRGELSSGGADRPSILADVMEALIGAVYRDSNFDTAFSLVQRIFGDSLKEVTPFDPKTELQEALHEAGSEPPSYLLELMEGPEHAPTFVTVVLVDGEIAGRGRGTTKKAAQQEAAAEALSRMVADAQMPTLKEGQTFFITDAFLVLGPKENTSEIITSDQMIH